MARCGLTVQVHAEQPSEMSGQLLLSSVEPPPSAVGERVGDVTGVLLGSHWDHCQREKGWSMCAIMCLVTKGVPDSTTHVIVGHDAREAIAAGIIDAD